MLGARRRFATFDFVREVHMDQQMTALPKGFDDLAPFVEEWGDLETQDDRYRRRQKLPMERLVAYYETVKPRLEAIFHHLDGFPFGQPLPAPQALLFRVVMGMTEVAQAVEVFGQPAVPQMPPDHSVRIQVVTRT
jgi:hypothetical protein